MSLRRRLGCAGLDRCGYGWGRGRFGSRPIVDGHQHLAHRDHLAHVHVYAGNPAGSGGRNGGHRLLVLQLHKGLIQLDLITLRDQDVDDGTGVRPFGQFGKRYVHGVRANNG